MKQVSTASGALLLDDATADTLLAYALLLVRRSAADCIELDALSPSGALVRASVLLSPATAMTVWSVPGPAAHETGNNALPVARMRALIHEDEHPVPAACGVLEAFGVD